MRAQTHNLAILEHDDLVGVQDRRDALRDDEHRSVTRLVLQRMTQGRIGLKVQSRKTVVEDIQVGALHERASNGQTLALATREVRTALRHRGIEPLRLIEHKGALGNLERMKHVGLSRVFVAKAQIACHGAREQPCFLRHIGNAPANLTLRKLAQVDAV